MKSILKNIKVIKSLIIFFAVLWAFTILSTFIARYTQPEVSLETGYSAPLEIKLNARSISQARDKEVILAPIDGSIRKVNITEGMDVNENDVFYEYNTEIFKRELKKVKNEKNLLATEKNINDTKYASFTDNEKSTKLTEEKNEIEKLKKEFEWNKQLFEIGAISKKIYLDSKESYEKRLNNFESFKSELAINEANLHKDILEINSKIAELNEKIKNLSKIIENEGKVYASINGIVSNLFISQGDQVSKDVKVCFIESEDAGMFTKIELEKNKAKYLKAGDSVYVTIPTESEKLETKVVSISTKSENINVKIVTLDFVNSRVKSGTEVTVDYSKKTKVHPLVIPKSAVGSCREGKFVWTVEINKKGFGDEVKVKKKFVVTGDKGNQSVVITSGIGPNEIFVTKVENNKLLKEGQNVTIYNDERGDN